MSIRIQEDFPFVVLTLSSSNRRNLLDLHTMEELCSALREYENDERCEVMIVTGNEEYFCFGGDLGEPSQRSVEGFRHFRQHYAECIDRLWNFQKS